MSNSTETQPPTSTEEDEPTSTPTPTSSSDPPSSTPTEESSEPPSTTPPPSSRPPSSTPESTTIVTSFITDGSTIQSTEIVTITSLASPDNSSTPPQPTQTGASSTSDPASTLPGPTDEASEGGLDSGAKTAIAVVVPVVVVALLVLAGIFLWRRRKQRKNAEDARRKEVEDYGYNPNADPTLPAVGGVAGSVMAEDSSGYRGWGTTNASNRKTSTTVSGGMTGLSDTGSNPGGYARTGSQNGGISDGHSSDPLMQRGNTMDSETVAALGAAPAAGANRSDGIRRGPSNASSHYSAAGPSNGSDDGNAHMMMNGSPNDYYYNDNAYYHANGYGGEQGGYGDAQQPVIRDVSARRNTRIENPRSLPQGNSGISQNF